MNSSRSVFSSEEIHLLEEVSQFKILQCRGTHFKLRVPFNQEFEKFESYFLTSFFYLLSLKRIGEPEVLWHF